MIGLTINTDAIRVVKLKKKGKKGFTIVDAIESPLYEGTIVHGRIGDRESLLASLQEIKTSFKLKDEEIYANIPDMLVKVSSFYHDAIPEEEWADVLPGKVTTLFSLNNAYIDFPYVYKCEDKPGMVVGYATSDKTPSEEYVNLFKEAGLNVVSLEPTCIVNLRYYQEHYQDNMMLMDVEYDYTTFTVFSSKHGMCSSKLDIGVKKLAEQTADISVLTQKAMLSLDIAEGLLGCSIDKIILVGMDNPFIIDTLNKATDKMAFSEPVISSFLTNIPYDEADLMPYFTAIGLALKPQYEVINKREKKSDVQPSSTRRAGGGFVQQMQALRGSILSLINRASRR